MASSGKIVHLELPAKDADRAQRFYSQLFGWEKMSEFDMGAMGMYVIFGRNGTQMGGMFNKSPEMTFPSNWLYYIKVDDVDKAVERVKANGGRVINGPMDVPGGDRIAQITDPQGGTSAVHAVKKA